MLDHHTSGSPTLRSQGVRTGYRRFLVAVLILSTGGLLLIGLGSARYGGLDGLWLRLRAEIVSRRAHPSLVPTPLAYHPPTATFVPSPTRLSEAASVGTPGQSITSTPGLPITPTPGLPITPTLDGVSTGDGRPVVLTATLVATATAAPGETLMPSPASVPAVTPAAELGLTPTLTLTSPSAHQPARAFVELSGFAHMWQTWNNCGPATLAMDLSYFNCQLDQAEVAQEMRPNREDKNVSPEEMAIFARAQGLEALVRVNGDAERLRLLLSNGLPVLIETWVEEEPGDGLGHYRLLTGYDDAAREWISYDSYISRGVDPQGPYRGIRITYDEAARHWAVFNHVYVVVYTSEMEPVVRSILGPDADDAAMWQRALHTAEQAIQAAPGDAFSWFNLGTDLVALEQFERATEAYDRARRIGLPWRMLWYQFGPFVAYYRAGRYDELIALTRATLAVTEYVEELHYWLGMGLQATGDPDGAARAFRRALDLQPGYVDAAKMLDEIGE